MVWGKHVKNCKGNIDAREYLRMIKVLKVLWFTEHAQYFYSSNLLLGEKFPYKSLLLLHSLLWNQNMKKMKTLNVALLPMQYRSNLISELSYLVNLCLFWNLNLLWIVRHSPYIYCNFYPQDGATVWNLGLKETSHWEAMLFVSSEGESWCDQLKCLQNVKKVTYPKATSKLLTFLLQVG